ncbi:serine/threonine-protein kinase [Erythrobacter donghaensis]|uniref:serine/threonine-protein kinase n=1 Tax=Erythrobacter donghaensis TaxID=267135 RepID=UPI000A3766AC|nr:serine/threonine-protein kinase [Erythrobacter donghaensis]
MIPILKPGKNVTAQQLDRAFDRMLDIAENEREAWLADIAREQPELAERLTVLATRERSSADLFARLGGQRLDILDQLVPETGDITPDPRIGSRYGPWLVEQHIGSGGLAEVYRVARADGRYEQQAAMKILRSGLLGGHARALFARERRLLANLDHPGIVRIIDGGETASGAPWLVMELAQGVPIDRYCEECRLPLSDRLALMVQAAEAVQAAHGRLVLHGDIKPDHIIVQGDGTVRLLDFGIAQALDENGIGRPGDGFTPRSASPEQQQAAQLTVASDVFQLGMVLKDLSLLAHGGRGLAPELSAVIAAATAPDPAARYATAGALANDLRAVIADRAPMVRPDAPIPALLRMARHHKLVAALALMVVTGAAGWGITASLSAAAIDRQRSLAVAAADREKRGKDALLTLFRRADLLEADSLGIKPEASMAMLDSALADARARLGDDPAMLAELTGWAARGHERAGDLPGALKLAREAERLAAGVARKSRPGGLDHAAARAYLGHMLANSGQAKAGADLVARSLADAKTAAPDDPLLLDLLLSAAWTHEGEWQVQLPLFRRALEAAVAQRNVAGEIEARSGLGRALSNLGQVEEARRELVAGLDLTRKRFGPGHPRLALPLSDLGRMETLAGNPAKAVDWHRQALALSEKALGRDHASTRAHRNNLAIALEASGDRAGASAELARLLSAIPDNPENALSRAEVAQNLAALLVKQGRYRDAEAPLALAQRTFADLLPAQNPRRAFPSLTRAQMRLAQSRWQDAAADAKGALAHLSATLPKGHFAIETARCRLGMALIGQGRHAEGGPLVRDALATMRAAQSPVPAEYLAPCAKAATRL